MCRHYCHRKRQRWKDPEAVPELLQQVTPGAAMFVAAEAPKVARATPCEVVVAAAAAAAALGAVLAIPWVVAKATAVLGVFEFDAEIPWKAAAVAAQVAVVAGAPETVLATSVPREAAADIAPAAAGAADAADSAAVVVAADCQLLGRYAVASRGPAQPRHEIAPKYPTVLPGELTTHCPSMPCKGVAASLLTCSKSQSLPSR
mmetsp:Transcript_72180/g.143156  ORF Transcript_72180/g.143156 Transcript_72180/m.143156 type:complete len:203 (-) Transcript_72180:517-1125(-)